MDAETKPDDVTSVRHPASTKHLCNICTMSAQRLRRWSDIVQMLYKCFVFSGHRRAGPAGFSVALSNCETRPGSAD